MLTFFTPVTSAMTGCGDGEKRATYSLPVSALRSCCHLLHTDAFVWNRGRPHKNTTHWSVSSFGWMAHIYQRALSVWSLNCGEFFGECVAPCEHLEETTLLSLGAHWCGVKTNSCHRGNFFYNSSWTNTVSHVQKCISHEDVLSCHPALKVSPQFMQRDISTTESQYKRMKSSSPRPAL